MWPLSPSDGYECPQNRGDDMRDILEALNDGEMSVREAEAALTGYLTEDAGRFDAARQERRGLPEAILAEGKTTEEVVTLAEMAVETTGHAIVTRCEANQLESVTNSLARSLPQATIRPYDRSGMLTVHASTYERPRIAAAVGVVSAGTSDATVAEEAAITVKELGAAVTRIEDVGVANLTRITDQLEELRNQDVIIVVAGREGALPTVVAGLVDSPVIGVPVSTGYGAGGDGHAALHGMLQSCTVLSVVNIDAGYIAGAQAGLIAQAIARTNE